MHGTATTQAAAVPGLKITWLIDADESRAKAALKIAPGAKVAQDMRKALDDKDVYLEKPLGRSIVEQRRLIEAVDHCKRIVQVETKWAELVDQANERLVNHGISLDDPAIKLSPVLELDSESERFTGEVAEKANGYLSCKHRSGFELPEVG